jgi:uncharacterized protein (DUF2384 family)
MTLSYDMTETVPLAEAGSWLETLDVIQNELSVSATLPEEAEQRLWQVLVAMPTTPTALLGVDPYLAQAILGGVVESLKALYGEDKRVQRRQLRIGIEQLRQALRDVISEEPASPSQSAGSLARWLVDSLHVSVGDVAGVVGVSERTFHRWMRDDSVEPSPDDRARLAMVARMANQLRHVFTGPGVIGWFDRPSTALAGSTPTSLLRDPVRYPEVLAAARQYRSMVAS